MVPVTPVIPSLISMPLELLSKIMKDTDWPSYFTLRKTCKTLRNYMIVHKPDVYIGIIHFTVTENGIEFAARGRRYLLRWNSRDTTLEQFFNNIGILLGHVKNRVTSFEVKLYMGAEESLNAELLEFLGGYLTTKAPKLDVDFFGTNALDKMAPVLANLHENKINVIRMEIPEPEIKEHRDEAGMMHRVMKEYPFLTIGDNVKENHSWRNAQRLFVINLRLQDSVLNYTHFVRIDVRVETLPAEHLIEIKKLCVLDGTKDGFSIRFRNLQHREQWTEMFGEGREERRVLFWYFKTAERDRIVKVELHDGRVDIGNFALFVVPQGGVIQD